MTNSMRAISQDVLGAPSVLHEISRPIPAPGLGQIQVRVHAAGLNPTDSQHRQRPLFLGNPPFTLGWDVSGTVTAIGPGVSIFAPGDEVFGMLPYPHGAGAFAEYVTGPARAFADRPDVLTHAETAALPMVGLVAWQALVETAHLRPGQRVLVIGASGGIGHVAVQVAHALGAYVIATASGEKQELVRALGADEVVDLRTTALADAVSAVDIVIDPLGGEVRLRALERLVPGGILVSAIPDDQRPVIARATELGVRSAALIVEHDRAGMEAIARLVTEGRLRPHIGASFPLREAAAAHAALESGATSGKVVLTVIEDQA